MSCMIGLLRLMEEDHFTALLESHEDQKSLKVEDSCNVLSSTLYIYNIFVCDFICV